MRLVSPRQCIPVPNELHSRLTKFPEYLKNFRTTVDQARRFRSRSECLDDAHELMEVCFHKRRSLESLLDEIPQDSKDAYHLKRWRQQFEEVCKLLDSDAPNPLTLAPDVLDDSFRTTEASSDFFVGGPAEASGPVSVAPFLLEQIDDEQLEQEVRKQREVEMISIAKDVQALKELQTEIARLVSDQGVVLSEVEDHMSNAQANVSNGNTEMIQAVQRKTTRGVRRVTCGVTTVTAGLTGGIVCGTAGAAMTCAVLGGMGGFAIGQSVKSVMKHNIVKCT